MQKVVTRAARPALSVRTGRVQSFCTSELTLECSCLCHMGLCAFTAACPCVFSFIALPQPPPLLKVLAKSACKRSRLCIVPPRPQPSVRKRVGRQARVRAQQPIHYTAFPALPRHRRALSACSPRVLHCTGVFSTTRQGPSVASQRITASAAGRTLLHEPHLFVPCPIIRVEAWLLAGTLSSPEPAATGEGAVI